VLSQILSQINSALSQINSALSQINWGTLLIALVITGMYLLLYLLIRWHTIVMPNRLELKATVHSIRADVREGPDLDQSIREAVRSLLNEAESKADKSGWRDFLFGSRGQE